MGGAICSSLNTTNTQNQPTEGSGHDYSHDGGWQTGAALGAEAQMPGGRLAGETGVQACKQARRAVASPCGDLGMQMVGARCPGCPPLPMAPSGGLGLRGRPVPQPAAASQSSPPTVATQLLLAAQLFPYGIGLELTPPKQNTCLVGGQGHATRLQQLHRAAHPGGAEVGHTHRLHAQQPEGGVSVHHSPSRNGWVGPTGPMHIPPLKATQTQR